MKVGHVLLHMTTTSRELLTRTRDHISFWTEIDDRLTTDHLLILSVLTIVSFYRWHGPFNA